MTCIIRDMHECNCENGGNCWAYTGAQRAADRQEQRRAERTVQAKHNAYRAVLVALTVASLCAFAGAGWNTLMKNERHYQQEARV